MFLIRSGAGKNLLKRYVLITFLGLIVLFFSLPSFWRSSVPPRVDFGKTKLSGSLAEVKKQIGKEAANFEEKAVLIVYGDKKINTTFSEIGLKIDQEKTALSLYNSFGEVGFWRFAFKWWGDLVWGYKVSAHYSFDLAKLEKLTGSKFNVMLSPVQDAAVQIVGNKTVLTPAKEGVGIDGMAVVAQVLRDLKSWNNEGISVKVAKVYPEIPTSEAEKLKQELDRTLAYPFAIQVGNVNVSVPLNTIMSWIEIEKAENKEKINTESDEDLNVITNTVLAGQSFAESKAGYRLVWDTDRNKIKNFVEGQVKNAIYRPAVNATLAFENGTIQEVTPSQSEITADVDGATEQIAISLKKAESFIKIPVIENPAALSLQNTKKLEIDTLIGKGESNFVGSPKNRRHNISVGSNKFNGVVIPKGEEFSFLTTLGPVEKSTGYLPELVIKMDKTVPEYGGGMCQVSSTCFRAAVNTGLRVTERQNHAYPVQYYSPQGTDATVYIPHPDLKFMNDTPGPILMQTKIVGNILTFEFFGKADGRTVSLEGPRVWDKKSDGSMKTEWIQKVYDKNGGLMFQKNFLSKYDSPSKYPHPGDEKPPEEKKKKKKKKGGT